MQFNPLQSEQTNTAKQSKSKVNPVPVPLTFLMVEKMLDQRQLQPNQSKLCLLGRVVRLKDMIGRTIVTLTDQTGVINIIEPQYADLLEENAYFRFIVSVRIDKEQPVLLSQHVQKVIDHNMLQFHMANIMFLNCPRD